MQRLVRIESRLPIRILAMLGASAILFSACSNNPKSPEDIEAQAFDDMRNEVRENIDDPGREADVLAIVDQLQIELKELRETAEQRRQELYELNADYDTTREQFAELLRQYDAELEERHSNFLKTRLEFISATTSDEWSAMVKSNTKAMAALAQSLASI